MPRRRKKNTPDDVAFCQKAEQALRMRRAGWSYDDIAEQMGLSHAASAYNLVNKRMQELRETTKETANEILQIEKDRLEGLWKSVARRIEDGDTDPKTIVAALRVCERKAKLFGLDKPTKVEHEVQFGMSRIEADNSSDHRVAVILLQKCAVLLGEDPIAIAREAILGLGQAAALPEASAVATYDAEFEDEPVGS